MRESAKFNKNLVLVIILAAGFCGLFYEFGGSSRNLLQELSRSSTTTTEEDAVGGAKRNNILDDEENAKNAVGLKLGDALSIGNERSLLELQKGRKDALNNNRNDGISSASASSSSSLPVKVPLIRGGVKPILLSTKVAVKPAIIEKSQHYNFKTEGKIMGKRLDQLNGLNPNVQQAGHQQQEEPIPVAGKMQIPPAVEVKLPLDMDLTPLWMSRKEVTLIKSFIEGKNITYFEWGSGGSTYSFARLARTAFSVEHTPNSCRAMLDRLQSHDFMSHVKYFCVPVNPGFKGWAGGYAEGNYEQFHQYIDAIDAIPEVTQNSLDVVLVDGRARLQCALKVLPFLKDSSIVLIHDFWQRSYYHDVLQYYEEVVSIRDGKGLVALKRKPLTEIRSLCKEKFNSDWPPYKI